MPFIKKYCIGNLSNAIPLGGSDWQMATSPAPSWGYISGGNTFIHQLFTKPGVYSCVIWQEDLPDTYTSVFIIAEECKPCNAICNINIAWLNIQGGWSSFDFRLAKNAKIISRSVDDDVRFKTYDANTGDIHVYSQYVPNVLKVESIITAYIKPSEMAFFEQLKYSVQTFLFNQTTKIFDIPVVIDKEEFELYKCGNGLAFLRLKLIHSEEIQVQRQ